MPRKKLSEFRAKTILSTALGQPYSGICVDTAAKRLPSFTGLSKKRTYVVKVDQGVKGRFKKGLVKLDVAASDVPATVHALRDKGYRYLLVEPNVPHEPDQEYYLAIERTRAGNMVLFSKLGGINVESQAEHITRQRLKPSSAKQIESTLGLPQRSLAQLGKAFEDNFFSFLEINPLVISDGKFKALDSAVEVDDEAQPFVVGRWTHEDFREYEAKSTYELAVEALAEKSQASFRLKVLNPKGAVFLLLSGGGASIVVADEVNNQGYGHELANYGEYSGNPSEEETYLYTRQLIALMLASPAHRKVLIIGGGVANFTDIRVTFRGVIRALGEAKDQLKSQGIKVYVRRGGPYEEDGLAMMEAFLLREGLHGLVAGPELTLSKIVPLALGSLTGESQ